MCAQDPILVGNPHAGTGVGLNRDVPVRRPNGVDVNGLESRVGRHIARGHLEHVVEWRFDGVKAGSNGIA